ncbi:MAG TPA: trypsin-like serine protease [Polyangiaceae bacterium]|nr:trypsin-like serine protease [Polyangiaceae bacterium]
MTVWEKRLQNEGLDRWFGRGFARVCALLVGTGIAMGCSGEAADLTPLASTAEPRATAGPPRELFNAEGASLQLVGKAETTTEAPRQPVLSGPPAVSLPTDENELAEGLRAVVLSNGYEYREATAPLELARRVLASRVKVESGELLLGSQPSSGSPPALGVPPIGGAPALGEREARGLIGGTEDRSYRSDNTSYPMRTLIFNDAVCTGFMIGPGTMVTAAHCVYWTYSNRWVTVPDPTVAGGSRWANHAPGVDGRDANPGPYGWQRCFDISLPSGYVAAANESEPSAQPYDYAVVDFSTRCGARPGSTVGWLGSWAYPTGQLYSMGVSVFGYPNTAGPYTSSNRNRIHGVPPNRYGEIWGMSGSVNPSGATALVTTNIDTSTGQSGAPYYNSDGYMVGIHYAGDTAETANYARRFDTDVFNFVDANSPYPQQQ